MTTDGDLAVALLGEGVVVGQAAPDFACVVQDPTTFELSTVMLADTPSTVRLFSVVPSLDTPVCSLQAVRFDAAVATLGDAVTAYTVSVDTPYAMGRFCRAKAVERLVSLSDYRPERAFGRAWGVLVEETGELCRAVFIVDPAGSVTYAEYVSNTADHPDYDAGLAALQAAVAQ